MTIPTAPLADQAPSDFDGDGTSDILWHNNNGDTGIWFMNAGGGFTSTDLGVVDPAWTPQATGDFNTNGLADILWRNSNGDVSVWLSNGGATPTGVDQFNLGNIDPSWIIQGTGDFTGAGASDILWRNTNGDTGYWVLNGGGGYTSVDLGVVDPSWSIQGIGDFNADNFSDILWRNANGEVGYWLSNGGSSGNGFTAVDLGAVDNSWVIRGVGDFNGDGASDILWRNTNGDTGIWLINADGSHTSVDLGVVDPSWTIQAVGDYNGGGKAGILWRNADGEVGEWLSTGGTGFNGFTKVVLANVDASWNIVGENPPAAASGAAAMAHAMAAMGAHATAPELVPAIPSLAVTNPMIAAPALQVA